MTKKNRRQFLKTAGALSAGGLLATGSTSAKVRTAEKCISQSSDIDENTFIEAEKLTGVPYSESERTLMTGTINQQISWAEQIRALNLRNEDAAPALVFDPRMPDSILPEAKWHRQEVSPSTLPGDEEDIAFSPITQLSAWIRSGQLKSRRLTEIYLKRIERYAPKLECMITITAELAREQADKADKEISAGNYRGLLHGIPYAAKDLVDTNNIRTTWGAMPYKNRIAKQDAAVIEKLNTAGAVLLGKTSLGALAHGDLWFDGIARNPWNIEEGSSGSSAGSGSAVAAGLMPFALGTETLGSIENPAAKTGVVGLRPSFGRVSRHGAMVLCWSLDKIGALCRSTEDSIIVLNTLNGYDARDPGSIDAPLAFDNSASLQGTKVGYSPEWFNKDLPADMAGLPGRAEKLGIELVKIDIPELPYQSMLSILMTEAAAAFDDLTRENRDDLLRGQTPQATPNLLRQARFIPALELIQADRFRRQVMEMIHERFAEVDVIMGPGVSASGQGTIMSFITNFTGHPALTIRAGFEHSLARRGELVDASYYCAPPSATKSLVPVALTLWGPLFEDGRLCQFGIALEKELQVQKLRPEFAT